MSNEPSQSPWMCHICDYSSTVGEGHVCSECYKITCSEHITISSVLNHQSGLYELLPICVACQFKKQL